MLKFLISYPQCHTLLLAESTGYRGVYNGTPLKLAKNNQVSNGVINNCSSKVKRIAPVCSTKHVFVITVTKDLKPHRWNCNRSQLYHSTLVRYLSY